MTCKRPFEGRFPPRPPHDSQENLGRRTLAGLGLSQPAAQPDRGSLCVPGRTHEQIYQKVCEEMFTEPLPADCPGALRSLVDSCRAYDSFRRPSTGGVDQSFIRLWVVHLDQLTAPVVCGRVAG